MCCWLVGVWCFGVWCVGVLVFKVFCSFGVSARLMFVVGCRLLVWLLVVRRALSVVRWVVIRCSLCVVCWSLLVLCCLLCVSKFVCSLLPAVYYLVFADCFCCLLFVVRCSLFVVRCLLFVVR